ncbi:hypothetical protein [Ruegeria sp. HKCCD8929]|uniref:COG3904 family protein n=1 Tax=Ruegeria sp. HKCCD8929 TaxID=2683006 RepID=UPI001489714D|nr:hypothetical protein [Ruegeria sp. HKCCD8929]
MLGRTIILGNILRNIATLARALSLILGLHFPSFALAEISWDNAIEAVSAKSSEYYDYALRLGSGHPGSALHGIGHDRHICAIAGRMLGFRDEIARAETFEDPPLTPQADPFELMEHSVFLDSWVAAARRATAMTESQKKSLWNLECIGNHGIPRTAYIDEPELKGDFSVLENTLVVYGDIDSGFHDRFRAVLDANPEVDLIALGSAGGSVVDAILSGSEIRKRGLTTTLHGPCFSACPLVFMGGERRTIWMGPGPHLGFHRVYTPSGEISLDDRVYLQIAEYLAAMDVDPIPVLEWMARAGSSEIFEPRLEQLCEPRVATWVQRICF